MGYCWNVSHRSLALLVLAANLFALGACSTSGTGSMAPAVVRKNAGPSTYIFPVDDTSCTGTCANEIAGINDSRDIVGNYSNCTSKSSNPCNGTDWSCNPGTTGPCKPCPLFGGANAWNSFTSVYNGGAYSSFASTQYPDEAHGQYMYAISDRSGAGSGPPSATIEVGCINGFAGSGDEEKGVWGLIDGNELWSVHDKGPSPKCDESSIFDATGELLGYDNTNATIKTAVGFYSDPSTSSHLCHFRAGEVQAGGNWQALSVRLPSFSPIDLMATGIAESTGSSGSGDIVGIATKSGTPGQVAWYLMGGTSSTAEVYSYTGSTATTFTGIAKVGTSVEIVGWYTLSNGALVTTHGLVATPPVGTKGWVVKPIDVPGASSTGVNGINVNGDVCGWYTDSKGIYHGFVAIGIVPALQKPRHQNLGAKHAAS